MVETASNGWGHFFSFFGTTTPSGLRALDVRNSIQWFETFLFFGTTTTSGLIALDAQKSIQWLGTFLFFGTTTLSFLTAFLQIISQILLQFHPKPLDARNSIQWLGTFLFFGTTTPSGLRAFFTNDFTNYTPISSPAIGWWKQHPMFGDIFFLFLALPPLLDLEHRMFEIASNGWGRFCFLALPPLLG